MIYNYKRASWSWEKTPEGYVGLHGRATVHKRGRKWFLTVGGRDYEVKTRRPSLDHIEGMLRELGLM